MDLQFTCKHFNDLLPSELYSILQLRNEVFVVEQNCVYQDCDDKDRQSYHLMGWVNEKLVAYTRLLPPGIAYNEMSIGRVVTSPSVRRTGAGKTLMERSIKQVHELFGEGPVMIGAQLYLRSFYGSLGFEQCSGIYLEDGIEHIKMIRR